MRSVPPRFHKGKAWNHASTKGKRGTFLDDPVTFDRDSKSKVTVSLPRAQDRTLPPIIVVCGPESVLPDVPAIHTIEMIPKSMILSRTCWRMSFVSQCGKLVMVFLMKNYYFYFKEILNGILFYYMLATARNY